jgi:predicted RNA polymerase sigma factor
MPDTGPAAVLVADRGRAGADRRLAGLALLGTLDTDSRMAHTHRLEAVHAHLLERAGDLAGARQSYLRAAAMTTSLPEKRYLDVQAARMSELVQLREDLAHGAGPADPVTRP